MEPMEVINRNYLIRGGLKNAMKYFEETRIGAAYVGLKKI